MDNQPLNLKSAIKPRMDTDAHGYNRVVQKVSFTRKVKQISGLKSVFIRVNPWLMISLSDSNCGIQDQSSYSDLTKDRPLPNERDQAVLHPVLILGIARQVPGQKDFLIQQPPHDHQQNRKEREQSPPRTQGGRHA
jgi:hypothetical protein